MSRYDRFDYFQILREGVKGADFVFAHQATVALDVGTQNGGEFAFDAVFGHTGTLNDVFK